VSDAEEPRDEPEVERIDKESEQRELEDAGWVRMERGGKTVWQNPQSGHLYPQGAAIALVRENAGSEDVAAEPEDGT
jgi:hypothetical protein